MERGTQRIYRMPFPGLIVPARELSQFPRRQSLPDWHWQYSNNLTGVYLHILNEIATSGASFKDKNALLTGVGKGSIGVEILEGLLSGGAHVVTTSRDSRATAEHYQAIFQRHGSKGFVSPSSPSTRLQNRTSKP